MGRIDSSKQSAARAILSAGRSEANKNPRTHSRSYRQVAVLAGFSSHQSVSAIDHDPALASPTHTHTHKPGPTPRLNHAQREIVAGKILHEWMVGMAMTQPMVAEWVLDVFEWQPSNTWVTRLAQQYKVAASQIRLQQTVPNPAQIKSKIRATLKKCDEAQLAAGTTVAIDASGFSVNKGNARGYGPSGSCVLVAVRIFDCASDLRARNKLTFVLPFPSACRG